MKNITYQFCLHNYKNEFEMLNRISYTIENYKEEMIPIKSCCYNQEFLKGFTELLLVDITPAFLTPTIFKFDFDDFKTEDEMMKEITETTLTYGRNIMIPTETFVIQLIHKIPNI